MPLILNGLLRPLLATTQALSPSITAGAVVEVDTGAEESFTWPVNHPSIDPPSFTVATCSAASGAVTLTTTASFASVRVGDVVSGTGITAASTVTAKASNTSLTLSAVTTAVIAGGTITFDPPAATPKLHEVSLTYVKSGSTITLVPRLIVYDGTGGVPRTINLVAQGGGGVVQDLDQFLTNFRLPRT